MDGVDSTFLIDVLKGNKDTIPIISRHDEIVTTQINLYEILKGIMLQKDAKLGIIQAKKIMNDMQVLPLDDAAIVQSADIYADLVKRGERISDNDCLIAGTLLSHGVKTIITRNGDHFKRIKGLKVISY